MAESGYSKPYSIDATILFIDLMGSVALSNTLTLLEYNNLLNDYQDVLRAVMDNIRERYPVAEYYLGGDQLAVFFYYPEDAGKTERIAQLRRAAPRCAEATVLEQELLQCRSRALYGALRCAVMVKNNWIGHPRNVARVASQQPVLDVGVGLNTGQVILQPRGDGRTRVEGFAINFAKRVEGFSRYGGFCKIMLSKTSYETFRSTVIGHSMLKQRAFFQLYTPQAGLLKGLAPGTHVYELKFFHQLAGFGIPPGQVQLYEQIFRMDPTNIWAYSNLMNYYLYDQGDLANSLVTAHKALYSNPENEKIYFDLAKINSERAEYELAHEYGQRCLALNSEMDIAYDLLGDIERKRGGNWEDVRAYRAKALALSPDSAAYHFEMAMALAQLKRADEAQRHYLRAQQLYPEIKTQFGELTAQLEELLGADGADIGVG
jgi:tetratricopeptide (TPR) repeat protein